MAIVFYEKLYQKIKLYGAWKWRIVPLFVTRENIDRVLIAPGHFTHEQIYGN